MMRLLASLGRRKRKDGAGLCMAGADDPVGPLLQKPKGRRREREGRL
jgi:hypothetical protein